VCGSNVEPLLLTGRPPCAQANPPGSEGWEERRKSTGLVIKKLEQTGSAKSLIASQVEHQEIIEAESPDKSNSKSCCVVQ
jgi:hypothetical protein